MNTKRVIKSVISATLLSALVSCNQDSNKQDTRIIDVAKIASDSATTNVQKAEKLAKASEQLLSLQGFVYADEVADLSLQADSANVRAQLVKAILAPIMIHKGIYKRVKPLADLDVKSSEEYARSLAKFEKETPNSTIKEFLLVGDGDIKDEADVQNYLDSMSDSFKAIREFAKKNKNAELTFMAGDSLYAAMLNRYKHACQVRQAGSLQYETNCPDVKNIMEINFNRADFEAIQQMAAGYELYFALVNSYNLTGAINKAVSSEGKQEDTRNVIENLIKNKDFATLRAGNGFQKVKSMGLDAVAAVRWIMKNQETLCPMGNTQPHNRVGMLLNGGLCMMKSYADKDNKNLALASDILDGKVLENIELGHHETYTFNKITLAFDKTVWKGYVTSVKPIAIFENPLTDLRNILPQTYDKCGNVTSVKDSSLGGVLVKSDLNIYLSGIAECDQN